MAPQLHSDPHDRGSALNSRRRFARHKLKVSPEADPTLDIDGHDAAQKLKILTELGFQRAGEC